MKSQELNRQLQQLRVTFTKVCEADSDPEVLAHWARYLCILCAGFLENALKEIFSDFVETAAGAPVQNYAKAQLSRIQNPNMQRFLDVVKSFKKSWADELETYANDSGRKDAVDSIMNNRHQIAHGKHVGITVHRVRDYLDRSVEVVEFVEELCAR